MQFSFRSPAPLIVRRGIVLVTLTGLTLHIVASLNVHPGAERLVLAFLGLTLLVGGGSVLLFPAMVGYPSFLSSARLTSEVKLRVINAQVKAYRLLAAGCLCLSFFIWNFANDGIDQWLFQPRAKVIGLLLGVLVSFGLPNGVLLWQADPPTPQTKSREDLFPE